MKLHNIKSVSSLFRGERSRRFEESLLRVSGSREERERRRENYVAKESQFLR